MKLQFKALSVTLGLVALLGASTSVRSNTAKISQAENSVEISPDGIELQDVEDTVKCDSWHRHKSCARAMCNAHTRHVAHVYISPHPHHHSRQFFFRYSSLAPRTIRTNQHAPGIEQLDRVAQRYPYIARDVREKA